MSRKKLYFFILALAFTGYTWVILIHYLVGAKMPTVEVCLFKRVTGIPCPSCGTTHAVLSILKGNFFQALKENTLGFPVAIMLLLFPFWIISDLLRKSNSFYRFYCSAESLLQKKWIAGSALIFILINWAWLIYRNRYL